MSYYGTNKTFEECQTIAELGIHGHLTSYECRCYDERWEGRDFTEAKAHIKDYLARQKKQKEGMATYLERAREHSKKYRDKKKQQRQSNSI